MQFSVFRAFSFVQFSVYSLHFAPFSLSSLVVVSYFFRPIFLLLAPKTSLFGDCFALFNHVFSGLKELGLSI